MAVSNRLQNATTEFLMPKLVEGVLTGNTGISYFLVRSKAPDWSGYQIRVPFKWQKNTNGQYFSGFDTLSTAPVDNTISLTYNAKFSTINVTLPKTDIAVNSTEAQVANLMERQIASDTYDLADLVGTNFYSGTDSGSGILGLAGIVDDGSTVATIGNQSRATYPALQATVTASGGTLTLAKMYTLHDAVSEGGQEPDLILTTKTIYSLYNQLLEPKERYQMPVASSLDKLYLGTGASTLMFRGAMVVKDSKCTSGVMFMLNSNSFQFNTVRNWPDGKPIKFAIGEMDGEPSPEAPVGLGFHATKWMNTIDQEAYICRVVHGGNFVAKNPRFNGKLTGITSI